MFSSQMPRIRKGRTFEGLVESTQSISYCGNLPHSNPQLHLTTPTPPVTQTSQTPFLQSSPYSFHPTAFRVRVRVRVTLRLTVSQSVCLGIEPRPGLMTRYLFILKVTVLSIWGALSDERSGLSLVSHSSLS
jgi:hypothetical protein